ncbi:MAG: DNA polymerase III subunit gamma/tau [Actinomycetota bacterium]|nr:DNA polymerase III subunit gamma/tau [Actinomycetota bacterium]
MSYISLYRKYRPRALSEVVGQDHITQTLKNAIKSNKISHAYLFSGPRGTGKTSVAKILAKSLNCKEGPAVIPCNGCSSCADIAAGNFVDVLEIDAASNRGIDEIRDLKEKIHFSPAQGRTKVYIIDEVHMLTAEAFNALLKTLEEPPAHVVFVLATTEPNRVPATILSRCQRFDFKRITLKDLMERLAEVAKAESIEIDSEALSMIAKHAQGSLRDGLGTLDQIASFTEKRVSTDDVVSLLGMSDVEALFEAADLMARGDVSAVFGFVDLLVDKGRDPRQFAKDLIEYLRALFVAKNSADAKDSLNVTAETFKRIEAQADSFSSVALIRLLDILSEAATQMRWEPDARLSLEMALVKMINIEEDISLDALVARIEALEAGSKGKGAGMEEPSPKELKKEAVTKAQAKEKAFPKDEGVSHSQRADEASGQDTDIERVKRAWHLILDEVLKESLPTHSLLLESAPTKLVKGRLTLNFNHRAAFHKDMIEREGNLNILTDSIEKIVGQKIKVECTIDENAPSFEELKAEEGADEEVLGKDNIIGMLMSDFGAEIEEG